MIHNDCGFEIRSNDRWLCIRLYGEIDHHNALFLREDLDELILRSRPERLILDLSGIEFMDSAGLGLLMGRYRLVRELGGEMAVDCVSERVGKILRLSGMERFFEIGRAVKGERL